MTKLKPSEKACLLLLMAEAREVSNSELLARYGVSITGADSRALVENKFATKRKGAKGALVHELTDEGWAQCKRELEAEYVRGTGPAYPALHALLGAVDRYLRRAELSLPDLFTASTPPPAPQPVAKVKPVVKRGLEKRVRVAYDKLADAPQAWVSLTDLRRELTGASAVEVDAALMKMAVGGAIVLVPEDNQKTLTDEDRAAAIHIGGEDKHLLSIEAA
ncbi:hypothetical protein [Catellatospora sp. NPDC049133]|jgi:hypothetical protein|uniref:hypothetical protein n=1 Tax=Catellatospora sp. NPDC049133 TaxID=3155499 RepID=UPI0033D186C2